MPEEETTETTEEAPKPENEAKGLRGQLDKALASRNKYKGIIMEGAYGKLGLEFDSGLGKAIAKEYEGEPDFDSLAAYAKEEYGYEPQTQEAEHPAQQQITQGHKALEAVGSTAGSVAPPTESDALAVAESNRDNNATIAMKGAQLREMMRQK